MRIVETKDGSLTFYNEDAKQCYHSVSGAIEEALEKHVRPSISQVRNNKKVRILDVCFGMGYNSAVALDFILEENPDCQIEIIAIENDIKVLNGVLSLNPKIKNFNIIKKSILKEQTPKNINIQIIVEDLKKVLDDLNKNLEKKDYNQYFDVVFFDPFSPKYDISLWTEEIFKKLYDLMAENAVLTTYSCASLVRINMARAGFQVKDGPKIGRRGPSTICIKKKNIN